MAYSHCLPAGLKAHPRNKSDEQLRFIAERGGFIGVTMFPAFLKRGTSATVDDYVEAIEYVINLCGEDCVGIGTDFTQGYDRAILPTGSPTTRAGAASSSTSARSSIRRACAPSATSPTSRRPCSAAAGPSARIAKVMGGNWLQLLEGRMAQR